jgi:hypothetical protein
MVGRGIIFIFLLCLSFPFFSQTDSLQTGSVKNKKAVYSRARKATVMSAILPGLGQVYNQKYLKVPLIYAGLGGFGYFFYVNNTSYNNYRAALISSVNNGGTAQLDGRTYSTSQLQTQKLYYRRFRDIGAIGVAVVYILNVIDANVDAHLKTFDVSDDLSINIDPWQTYYGSASGVCTATGFSIKLNFR